jgi:uncharacterized protein (UPF0332 family)
VTEDIPLHLARAEDCIAEAELLLTGSRAGAAISRAYYAMLHAATAALMQRGITRHSHRGVIAAFGQTFAKPKLVDAKFHKHFADAFDLRQENDYQPVVRLTEPRAQEVLDWAREFVAVCRDLCE